MGRGKERRERASMRAMRPVSRPLCSLPLGMTRLSVFAMQLQQQGFSDTTSPFSKDSQSAPFRWVQRLRSESLPRHPTSRPARISPL
jgi:hypothetical protein